MPNYSIYSPYDSRFQNPSFNQQSGQMGSFGPSSFGGAPGGGGLPNYNVNSQPTGGNGPYGLVPGPIDVPPSLWQQTTSAIPALGNTSQLTGNIMSELQGDINPQALKNMQDAAAAYGVSSGMPGSNAIPGTLAFNKNLRNIGLDTQAIQHQGAQDYNSLLGAVAGLQTPQSLAAEIAAHNAQLKAAPDPQQAAEQQLRNYWNALNALRGPGGGTGQGASPSGGTGFYAPQVPFAGGTPSPQYQGGVGGGSFGGTTSTIPGGSSSTWTGQDFGELFGDPYGGTPSPSPYAPPSYDAGSQSIYNPASQQSTYDPYAQYGGSYFDQSAPTDFSNMTDEDYLYSILGGE